MKINDISELKKGDIVIYNGDFGMRGNKAKNIVVILEFISYTEDTFDDSDFKIKFRVISANENEFSRRKDDIFEWYMKKKFLKERYTKV